MNTRPVPPLLCISQGMNIPFDFPGGKPVILEPIRTMEQVNKVSRLVPEESCSFVGKALTQVITTPTPTPTPTHTHTHGATA